MSTHADWQYLEWDSNTFGFATAKILESVTAERLPEALHSAAGAGVRLAYLSLPPASEPLAHAAKAAGGALVDRRVTFSGSLPQVMDSTAGRECVSTEVAGPLLPDLRELALAAGEYSRFRRDPRFPGNLFEQLYSTWLARSLSREIADAVFVTRDASGATGVVTLGQRNGRADVGLISVAARARGQGLAACLIRTCAKWACRHGHTAIQVVTQQENEPACALYRRCGFTDEQVALVFHFWL